MLDLSKIWDEKEAEEKDYSHRGLIKHIDWEEWSLGISFTKTNYSFKYVIKSGIPIVRDFSMTIYDINQQVIDEIESDSNFIGWIF